VTVSCVSILVDVGVGKAVEDWLRDRGYDVAAVRELDSGMEDAPSDEKAKVVGVIFTARAEELVGQKSWSDGLQCIRLAG